LKLCLRSAEVDELLGREIAIVDDQVVDNYPPISEKLEKVQYMLNYFFPHILDFSCKVGLITNKGCLGISKASKIFAIKTLA